MTTAGEGIRELAEEAKQKGEYLRSYALQALALETAEAAAEWIALADCAPLWGFADRGRLVAAGIVPGALSRQAIFVRLSGLPRSGITSRVVPTCCSPEEIGVELTEGFMMEPEASVSALVFHHPDATYFSVGAQELAEATAD